MQRPFVVLEALRCGYPYASERLLRRRRLKLLSFVWAYAGLGDNEQAFAWLETSYQERRDRMIGLNIASMVNPLRSDPRFQDLLRRIGLASK